VLVPFLGGFEGFEALYLSFTPPALKLVMAELLYVRQWLHDIPEIPISELSADHLVGLKVVSRCFKTPSVKRFTYTHGMPVLNTVHEELQSSLLSHCSTLEMVHLNLQECMG
jgi:hypothetical protein